ncbi:MAG: hypothetical protein ACLUOL_03215 [Faecalibacterium sp.]
MTAPAAGKVVETGTDDKWGPVVAIEDASGRVWRVCCTTDQGEGRYRLGRADHRQGGQRELRVRRESHIRGSHGGQSISTPSRP